MSRKYDMFTETTDKEIEKIKVESNIDGTSEIKRKARRKGSVVGFNELSKEEKHRIQSMGGKVAHAKRKQSIILADTMKMLMEMPLADEDAIRNILIAKGIDSDMLTEATAICYTQLQRAKQDSKAFEVVRDTIGQKPVERQVVVTQEESPESIISKHFGDM